MAVSSLPAEPRPPVPPLHAPFDEVDQAPVEEALYFLSAGRHLFGGAPRAPQRPAQYGGARHDQQRNMNAL